MGVGQQNGVNRQIGYADPSPALPAEQHQARRKHPVHEQRSAGDLNEEGGVPDKCDGGFTGFNGGRNLRVSNHGLAVTFPHQSPELTQFHEPERNRNAHHLLEMRQEE